MAILAFFVDFSAKAQRLFWPGVPLRHFTARLRAVVESTATGADIEGLS